MVWSIGQSSSQPLSNSSRRKDSSMQKPTHAEYSTLPAATHAATAATTAATTCYGKQPLRPTNEHSPNGPSDGTPSSTNDVSTVPATAAVLPASSSAGLLPAAAKYFIREIVYAPRPQQQQYQVIRMPKNTSSANRPIYTQPNYQGCDIYWVIVCFCFTMLSWMMSFWVLI